MIENIIKTDYILSKWFSKTEDKVVPGTAFLFLNKVVFAWASFFFALTGIASLEIDIAIFVGVLVSGGAIIMYGFQKKTERYVDKLKLAIDYSN